MSSVGSDKKAVSVMLDVLLWFHAYKTSPDSVIMFLALESLRTGSLMYMTFMYMVDDCIPG